MYIKFNENSLKSIGYNNNENTLVFANLSIFMLYFKLRYLSIFWIVSSVLCVLIGKANVLFICMTERALITLKEML